MPLSIRQQVIKNDILAKRKEDRRTQKTEKFIESKKELDLIRCNWPSMVSSERIAQCLRDYQQGTIWKTPSACAACAHYSESNNIDTIAVDCEGKSPLPLALLHVMQDFITQHTAQSEFLYAKLKFFISQNL
jgi:hypothetical protein